MMKRKATLPGVLFLVAGLAYGATESLLEGYRNDGAGPFSPKAGESAWMQEYPSPGDSEPRSCTRCHGADLTRPGRHLRTGKPIEPMALSVNPARLSNPGKVEKWFRRNCRWTLGRECTTQEKGDFIQFMISQ
jgi:hypothetical protein